MRRHEAACECPFSRSRPTILAIPRPVRREVLDEIEQGGGRGVVDQRHQVGDVQADGGDPRRNPIELPFEVQGVEANQRTAEVEVVGIAHRSPLCTTGLRNSSPLWTSHRRAARPKGSCSSERPRTIVPWMAASSTSFVTMPAAMPQSRSVVTVTRTVAVNTKSCSLPMCAMCFQTRGAHSL